MVTTWCSLKCVVQMTLWLSINFMVGVDGTCLIGVLPQLPAPYLVMTQSKGVVIANKTTLLELWLAVCALLNSAHFVAVAEHGSTTPGCLPGRPHHLLFS